jgi:hypothetical protein
VDLLVELLRHQAVAVEQDFSPTELIQQLLTAVTAVQVAAVAVPLMVRQLLTAAMVVFLFTTRIEGE